MGSFFARRARIQPSKLTFLPAKAIHELYEQFKLGSESRYAPYVNYLLHQPTGRLVDEWSDAGKALLNEMLGHNGVEPNDGLPPQSRLMGFEDVYLRECQGEDTPLARQAFHQFTSRDEDSLMVPFFDMHNHSSDPEEINMIPIKPDKIGEPFVMRATRDIPPGQQIVINYNRCNPCWHDAKYADCQTRSNYMTPEIFESFGFVESLPQGWKFRMDVGTDDRPEWDTLFMCLRKDDEGTLEVTFGDNYTPPRSRRDEMPMVENVRWLSYHVDRLVRLGERMGKDTELRSSMPSYEWETIGTYRRAVLTAMSAAILASDLEDYGDYDEEEALMDSEKWEGERMEKRKDGPPPRIREEEGEGSSDDDDSRDESDDDSSDDSSEDDGEASEFVHPEL